MSPTETLSARRKQLLPLAAALVTVGLWASAFVGIRTAGNDLSPDPLALGRLVIGSLVLGWALLGEIPGTLAFLGGALCIAGVAISRLER